MTTPSDQVHKGIVIRIRPNEKQRQRLAMHFGVNRWVWNYFLGKRIKEYKDSKISGSYLKDCKELTALKKEHAWLFDASISSKNRTLRSLNEAYKNFYSKRAKFPSFKTKKRNQSFSLSSPDIKFKQNKVCFPRFAEGIKFNRKLPPYTKINSITIKQTPSGKYYAVLNVKSKTVLLKKTRKKIGIDLGIKDFAVLSNGERIKPLQQSKKLKRAQQHLSRKLKGSNRFEKQRQKTALVHEKIANSRKNFLHQVSKHVVINYDFIAIETLVVRNMVKNPTLARVISEASWGEFIRQLEYKASWYGKELVKVGRFYPSTKTCNSCGIINQTLTLKERNWVCDCGVSLDRDINAAKNILQEGKRISGRLSPNTNVEAA